MRTPLKTTHNYISHPGTNCCRPRGPLITFFISQNSFSHSDVQTNTKSFSRRALIFCSIWMKSHRKLQNPFRRPNRDLTSMVFWDLLAHIWPWLVLVCKNLLVPLAAFWWRQQCPQLKFSSGHLNVVVSTVGQKGKLFEKFLYCGSSHDEIVNLMGKSQSLKALWLCYQSGGLC